MLVTVSLYYELYVNASVAPRQLPALHMSFTFLVNLLAVANLIGAFGSLFAGLTDRIGRCNLVVGGLLVTGVLVAFVIPNLTTRWPFAIATAAVGLVEGICLVATPALIRDFSPQVGRATAMGFWTMGPVLGSLVVAVVASNTLHPSTSWGHEYVIAGVAGLVVFAIALVGLRELSPALRDQLMVTLHDRALIEARAKGIDIEASLRNPWGQLLRLDVLASAFGVGVLLLIYYVAVGFGQTYLATVFGFSLKDANGLGNWNWAVNAVVVLIAGVLSDILRVRKPFMIVGGIGTAVMIVVYLEQAGHHPGYYTLAAIISVLSAFLAVAYCPWMASFTETVESHNPALTATGLAIWGWIIRVIVFVSYIILPHVITTVTPLVTDGPVLQAKYPALTLPSSVLTALAKNPGDTAALHQAEQILGPKAIPELLALKGIHGQDAAMLAKVEAAQAKTPGQWKDFYWICFGGAVVFLPAVLLMKGRWSPRRAREDEAAHEAMVDAELARMRDGAA
ncbi:MAG TPA: MFS transporter [Acidimicrobiales bacterium]|nr:MFS transporter [Acidimicrobiales bacterium]